MLANVCNCVKYTLPTGMKWEKLETTIKGELVGIQTDNEFNCVKHVLPTGIEEMEKAGKIGEGDLVGHTNC